VANVRDLAKKDWRRFSQSSFDLDITLTSPPNPTRETVVVKGIGTRNIIKIIETDGQEAIGENVHIGINEPQLIENNPNYPVRNADGLVDLNGHQVAFVNSNNDLFQFRIKNVYPDSTVGMIMADLEDLKINP